MFLTMCHCVSGEASAKDIDTAMKLGAGETDSIHYSTF